jgi:endothelin-converting enzyme/putative endopeptidase
VAKDMVAKDMVAKDMVAKVREGVTARVAAARWMAEVDRGSARESLKSLDALLGLPSRWPAVALEVEPRAHTANVLAARAARARQASSAAGQPVDRSSWPMSTLEPALSYLPGRHQLALSAMLLQPPVLSPKATVASTMGSLGPLLARAMLRTVDEHGSQFDGRGKRVAGWHDETRAAFAKRASCLEKQFASDQLRAGVSLDPKRTLRENAVELGALEIAYRLYHEPREGAAERFVADGHNEDQQFFLAYAQSQCTKYAWRTETLRAATEPQAQADLRVNGALRNHSAFGQAFLCTDAAMAPKQRCEVW